MARQNIKPVATLKGKYRKSELEFRERVEKASRTGETMQAPDNVKSNPYALKQFNRIKNLYAKINYEDALFTGTISRYCIMLSEEQELMQTKKDIQKRIEQLTKAYTEKRISEQVYFTTISQEEQNRQRYSRLILSHRRMLLDLERCSLLTLAESIRAIPTKPPEEPESDISKFLRERKR